MECTVRVLLYLSRCQSSSPPTTRAVPYSYEYGKPAQPSSNNNTYRINMTAWQNDQPGLKSTEIRPQNSAKPQKRTIQDINVHIHPTIILKYLVRD